jgi:hypothetical protein
MDTLWLERVDSLPFASKSKKSTFTMEKEVGVMHALRTRSHVCNINEWSPEIFIWVLKK